MIHPVNSARSFFVASFGKLSLCLVALALVALTSGCGLGVAGSSFGSSTQSSSVQGIHGLVHGGQQPISGASVVLYAAGTTGYGTGAASVMTSPVSTDANGNFTLTGNYSCSAGQQMYLVASGGSEISSATSASITAYSLSNNVATFTAANNFAAGQSVTISGLSTLTAMNGTFTVLATGLSTSQFAVPFTGAVATASETAGNVTAVNVTSGGSGYPTAPSIVFSTSGATTPATATANMSGTSVASVTVNSAGIGYTSNPTVTFSLAGSDAGTATPGSALGANSATTLIAALGDCGASGFASQYIVINEVTTVASVWALQQFMAAPASGNVNAPAIGAPSTNYCNTGSSVTNPTSTASCNTVSGVTPFLIQPAITGLKNAFNMARLLADPAQGASPNYNYSYATPETTKINTLANILAGCINSTGPSSSACTSLFSTATPSTTFAGATPFTAADTAQAAWYIAQYPVNNVTALYNLVTGTGAAFSNALSASPTDFTIAVNLAPQNSGTWDINNPWAVAIDAYGNAWISNAGSLTSSATAGLTELGPDGTAATTPLTSVTANVSGGAYAQFTTIPASNTFSNSSSPTLSLPKVVAIDLANNPWMTIDGTQTGTPTASLVMTANGSSSAQTNGTAATSITGAQAWYTNYTAWGLAIDASNNIYVASSASSSISQATLMNQRSVSKMSASGANYTFSTSSATTAPNATPGATTYLAIDANSAVSGGILWAATQGTCKYASGVLSGTVPYGAINMWGTSAITTPLSGSEAATVLSKATVGAGSASNCGSSSLSMGQVGIAGMANPYGVAIDRNNGAWLPDEYTSSLGFDGLTYVSAPTASTGIIPSSWYYANGINGPQYSGSSGVATGAGTAMAKPGVPAIDGNNNVWFGSQSVGSLTEATLCTSTTGYYCGNYTATNAIALLTPTAAEVTAAGATGAYGLGFVHKLGTTTYVAVDPSGNVWATNTSASSSYTNGAAATVLDGNSMTVLVGGAGPVITPMSVALANKMIGQKP